MKLKELRNKKILILGMAKEGLDTLAFLRKIFPEKVFGLADRSDLRLRIKDRKIKRHFGENYLEALKDYDAIIKSPGVPVHLPEIEKAFKQGKITSQTELFFNNCKGKIIGITGTKGKGTASSIIYEILRKGGKKAHLVGNIGTPSLSFLRKSGKRDIFVYEVSSHQLYGFKKSPHIAVFLNVFPAHLDFFKSFKEYSDAKENIALYQKKSDIFIFCKDQPLLKTIAKKTKAEKISFSAKDGKTDCFVKNGSVFYKNKKILEVKDIPLKGEFNLLNVMPGIIIGRMFGISSRMIANAIKNFKAMPYRLEYVGTFSGIKFYNDSLATIPEATISAIKALGEDVQTIMLGGFDSGLSYKNMAKEIVKSRIRNMIFFPPLGKEISGEIRKKQSRGELRHFFAGSMKEAVNFAYKHTQKGKICLLSPGAPSFGIFRDYKERGDLFKKYVKRRKKAS